jgi:1-deoxy-D-xylulose-5-phosphate synthase
MTALPLGKGEVRRHAKGVVKGSNTRVAILAFGTMVYPAITVGEEIDATVVNMRFVKPLDQYLVLDMADSHELLVTIEENVVMGGAGSAINELLVQNSRRTPVLNLGIPDEHIDHGTQQQQLTAIGLDCDGIKRQIFTRLENVAEPVDSVPSITAVS